MDELESKYVTRVAFKTFSEFAKLVPIINKVEDKELASELAASIKKINILITSDILIKLFERYPEIENEYNETIKRFGKLP